MANKKLIEVALPLEQMNAASEYEKLPGIGPHPRGIHHWWARRPFTTTRAIIWASIVDDPSSHPEQFPTEEEQKKERQRLFDILTQLSDWKSSNNKAILNEAKEEILKSTHGAPPALLDPFAGGGAIPFEAARLGLKTYAYDLNPVAVLINKAMTEIPGLFMGYSPVNPETDSEIGFSERTWEGTQGLTKDIVYYGKRLNRKAYEKVGYMYPKVRYSKREGNNKLTVVAWIWARTVKCPNPACGCELPLIKNYTLSNKKGREAYVHPVYDDNKQLHFEVINGKYSGDKKGTINRSGAICPCCNLPVDFDYIRKEGKEQRLSQRMIAIVAEGNRGKVYLSPDPEQEAAADVPLPYDYPKGDIAYYPGCLNTSAYGMDKFEMLFSNRQMQALVAFSDALIEIRREIEHDAIVSGMSSNPTSLDNKGTGAKAYSEALCVYLAFSIDRMSNFSNTVTKWAPTNEKVMFLFNRQAISMTWDYPEANIFGNSVGNFLQVNEYIADCVYTFPVDMPETTVDQWDAQEDCGIRNVMISTDPPYYDNVPYSDLSDFFYIWLRRNVHDIYPELFKTVMTPKNEEIVAQRYRHKGNANEAKTFFEQSMLKACKNIYKYAIDNIPVTIYYAYKQGEINDDGVSSNGWETMLSAIINAGFYITGTWPVRTEMTKALKSDWNALASSIVLVCRKRDEDAPKITRHNLITILQKELRPALRRLQESNIAPVDLAQSAIGPGMAVYSRYSQVLEADGTPMTVRSALQVINGEIDLYFNEQVGNIDAESRFCVDLYTQYAYNDIKYGEAEVLANAKGVAIPLMVSHGVLYAKAGIVHLIERKNLPEKINSNENNIWLLTQQLTFAMEQGGVDACAKIVTSMFGSNAENAKDLAYRLYTIADQKKWNNEAYAYNALVVAWPDIQSKAAEIKAEMPEQLSLFDLNNFDN